MILAVALALLAALALWRIVAFLTADADLTLLQKGRLPPNAFDGKVVWLTGASQGIGLALAKDFARAGARLILSSRREKELLDVKSQCTGKYAPDQVEIVSFDLAADDASIKEAVHQAEAVSGGRGIDYLIHNAAYARPKIACIDTPEETLKAMFAVNVFGTIAVTRAALPGMLQKATGRIVVVSSAAGKVPSPAQGAYAATKHALNGYFRTLRYEVCKQGVGVTILCPGPIAASAEPDTDKTRMTVERCAELITAATGHGVEEAWISRHPVLFFMYVDQYLPWLSHILMKRIGPSRMKALKHGEKGMYDTSLLFSGSRGNKES
eukprot:SM000105S13910  [mRNA]  locus=s105:334606:337719:- [translate_table: standard]